MLYASSIGFHGIDMETGAVQDLYVPNPMLGAIHPHAIISLPRSSGSELLLCYDSELHSSACTVRVNALDCTTIRAYKPLPCPNNTPN